MDCKLLLYGNYLLFKRQAAGEQGNGAASAERAGGDGALSGVQPISLREAVRVQRHGGPAGRGADGFLPGPADQGDF